MSTGFNVTPGDGELRGTDPLSADRPDDEVGRSTIPRNTGALAIPPRENDEETLSLGTPGYVFAGKRGAQKALDTRKDLTTFLDSTDVNLMMN